MFYIYFLKSLKNEKVYVGSTSKNPETRLVEHNNGSNSFTKLNAPFELIYSENYFCKKDAILREKFYKSGFGRQIKDLIVKYTLSLRTRSSAG